MATNDKTAEHAENKVGRRKTSMDRMNGVTNKWYLPRWRSLVVLGSLWLAGAFPAGAGNPVAAAPSGRITPPWGTGEPGQVRTRDFELATAADFGATGQVQALVIGISAYRNLPPEAQLLYAEADATAFRDFLVSPQGGGKPENVTLLVNQEARQVAILRQLEKLQARCGPNDVAIIFFAGHGVVNGAGQGFLLANDSRPDDLLVTAVEMGRFNDVVRHLRARSVVIFSDACHSGAIGSPSWPGGLFTGLASQFLADSTNRWGQSSFVFSAAASGQTSLEVPALGHGLFTFHLLQGLAGAADTDHDGLVTARELSRHVISQVRDSAAALSREQTPENNPQYDRSIPLAVLSEAGRQLCLRWFESDPFISFSDSCLAEALERGALTRPERENAWSYFTAMRNDPRAPADLVEQRRQLLLSRLSQAAQEVIEGQPREAGRWEEAREWLEKAVLLAGEPGLQARLNYCLAVSRWLSGETGSAQRAGEDALAVLEGPGSPDAGLSLHLARFFRELKQLEKARRCYRLAVTDPPRVDGLTEYAEVLLSLSQVSEAETQLRKALGVEPENLPALRLLGEVLLRTGDRSKILEAQKIVSQALTRHPDDIVLEDILGRSLLGGDEAARAVSPLRRVAQARLGDAALRDEALLNLSRAYAGCLDLERAVSSLREAQRQGSRSVAVYDALSGYLERLGDLPAAIAASRQAEDLSPDGGERSRRLRRVAELQERIGDLAEAAFTFRDAARAGGDARSSTALERHASVLLHCAGRPQDAGALPLAPKADNTQPYRATPVIVPAGLAPLQRLTGLRLAEDNRLSALADVFDACLRDPATAQRVIQFYEIYPEFIERLRKKGFSRGTLKLPAFGQPLPAAAEAALDYLGLKDKKDRRDVDEKDFYARRAILEGLGLDPARVAKGEAADLELPGTDDQLPVLLGLDGWLARIRDGRKAPPEEQLLAFLRDDQAMLLYVGLSLLPQKTANWFTARILDSDNGEGAPLGLYFAAPYLRCSAPGPVVIPGERQGELNWQQLVEARSSEEVLKRLLRSDNWGALYLFAALSAAGPAGDQISRSPQLEQLWRPMKEARYPAGSREPREPFDLVELLRLFRQEDGRPDLPPAVRGYLKLPSAADPLAATLGRVGAVTPGGTIPLARQLSALARIGQEMPEWVADPVILETIGRQLELGRDGLVEVAIDLRLDGRLWSTLAGRADEIASIQDGQRRTEALRTFQSALELLRILSRQSALAADRLGPVTERFLALSPGSDDLAPKLVALLREDLLDLAPTEPGAAVERDLVAALAARPPLLLPQARASGDGPADGAACLQFAAGKVQQGAINRYLGAQLHTRLACVVDVLDALRALAENPADGGSLERLRAASQGLVEPEPPAEPAGKDKKKKSKEPVPEKPSLKSMAAGWSVPVPAPAIQDARRLAGPFLGEALLGLVYATGLADGMREVAPEAELVCRHDFGARPWGETRFDRGRRVMEGSAVRLPAVMAGLEAFGTAFGGTGALLPTPLTPFVESVLESVLALDRRWVSDEGLAQVARTTELGGQVLALHLLGDPIAREAVEGLSGIMTPRRVETVRSLLDGVQVQPAIAGMTPSEKFHLGQAYLLAKIRRSTPAELAVEPGPLGLLAGMMNGSATVPVTAGWPQPLRRSAEQFGTVSPARCGLHRLALGPWHPYEFGLAVKDPRFLADRLLDFRLALAQACFRRGCGAAVALSPELAREALYRLASTSQHASGGRLLPEKDWPGLVALITQVAEQQLAECLQALSAHPATRPLPEARWNDQTAPLQSK